MVLPDEQSHGLKVSILRNILQHKNESLTILGLSSIVRKMFRPNSATSTSIVASGQASVDRSSLSRARYRRKYFSRRALNHV